MKFIRSIYATPIFFYVLGGIIFSYTLGYFIPFFLPVGHLALMTFSAFVIIDILALYRLKEGLFGTRICPDKLSNGDKNKIEIYLENNYPFTIKTRIIDELPIQFQIRDFFMETDIKKQENKKAIYHIRPTKRGEYAFGALNIYVTSPIHLIRRRYRFDIGKNTKVYPSFIQMRQYELMAVSNRLTMLGIKKIRRLGHNMEFEHIKEYVPGDDVRAINWKATARRSRPMVNQYQDERSQNVYNLIDMGRVMKMPFEELSLLDYAINSSLVISNIALHKEDKAGIISFSNKIHHVVPAERKSGHIIKIMDMLYAQTTDFKETSFEHIHGMIQKRIGQRSLLLLYTNFESLQALERQMIYLKRLSRRHLLVVIFFENTELTELTHSTPKNTEGIYIKTIAEKFSYEKKLIAKELEKHGIFSILTAPKNLTVNTVNKYLELKARGLI